MKEDCIEPRLAQEEMDPRPEVFNISYLSWRNWGLHWAIHWLLPPRSVHSHLACFLESMIYSGKQISFLPICILSQTLVNTKEVCFHKNHTGNSLGVVHSFLFSSFWKVLNIPDSSVLWCSRHSAFLFITGILMCMQQNLTAPNKVALALCY